MIPVGETEPKELGEALRSPSWFSNLERLAQPLDKKLIIYTLIIKGRERNKVKKS